ncbi:MAG: metal-dependent hydrolase [Acidobacteriaceae bacterium]
MAGAMEPVTHFLTGACLGRAGFNRKTTYATLVMILAAEAPDVDVLWALRGPVAGFEHHRGITHTLLGAPLVDLVVVGVVWLLHRLRRKPLAAPPRWLLLGCFALIAVLSHLLLDYTNNYGLRPFFPFNPHWYAADIFFIFDPILFAMLVLALVIPAILGLVDREVSSRRSGGGPVFRGRGWAIAALIGVVALYALRAGEHAHALRLMQQTSFGTEPALRYAAEPYPVDPFHWEGIVETRDYYQFADLHTRAESVDTDQHSARIYKPPVTAAVAAAKQSWLGRVYLSWSSFPLVEDVGKGTPVDVPGDFAQHLEQVDFHDLRFGYSGWLGAHSDHKPLSGSVFVAPDGQIEAQSFDGKPQR